MSTDAGVKVSEDVYSECWRCIAFNCQVFFTQEEMKLMCKSKREDL